ncbi:MAG TPA: UDP-N-acetyl-D-mannosamine transferase [Treponema sp.]|nr:UDP-N-acetyl-D-mannosamine transferase [Treponema sp.]HBD68755.1 UDP-N-acetyl-D-mannosamine transferase [Treponema sp.]
MAVQRIKLLGVPVDILPPQDMETEILELLAKPGTKQIVFMSVWDLLKARRKNDYAQCVREADLVLPVSKSILRGARFLKKEVPVRYNQFTAVISILSVLENHYKSLYLLGGRKKALMAAERNVRSTFPGLQIVGRYVGYYPKAVENDIVQAIFKASPSLALVSDGIREKDCWSYTRRNRFSSSIFLYYRDGIGIFSERIKRVKEKTFERGLEIWSEILHNPLKLFLIFPYIYYIVCLLWYKLFKRNDAD